MSGAQWSAEELNALADWQEDRALAHRGPPSLASAYRQSADALRAFARVVSVLERIAATPDPRYQRDSWGTVAGHLSGVLMVAREALAAHATRMEKG